jgi:hypothetical protein
MGGLGYVEETKILLDDLLLTDPNVAQVESQNTTIFAIRRARLQKVRARQVLLDATNQNHANLISAKTGFKNSNTSASD